MESVKVGIKNSTFGQQRHFNLEFITPCKQTLKIKLTGKIKRSEERTQLDFVRVQRLIMCFYIHVTPHCVKY